MTARRAYRENRSNPSSPKFGQFYSPEEVTDIFAPAEDSVETVKAWLVSAGVPADTISQSVNKQWIQFDAHVEDAEKLLKTKYHLWEHGPTGKTNVACDEYSLPVDVRDHVDYVTPGIKLSTLGSKSKKPAKRSKFQKRTFGVGSGAGLDPPKKKPMPVSVAQVQTTEPAQMCDMVVTPECIRTFYNFTQSTTAAKDNELGIFEDLGDVFAQEDFDCEYML